MKIISLDSILVLAERQRKEFLPDKLKELSQSIADIGLLQPIVLRNDSRTLVSGERRIRALQELNAAFRHDNETIPPLHAPFVTLDELSPDALFQAELEENLRRVNLTWQEEAKALLQFHRARQSLNPGQTFVLTAREAAELSPRALSALPDFISNASLLEPFLDNPVVAAAKDVKEARKLARELAKAKHRQEKLTTFITENSTPHELFQADSLIDAPARYQGFFDCIVTDPPYGINMHQKENFDSQKHEYDDSPENFSDIAKRLPRVARGILKPDGHIYVFCDIRKFSELFVEFSMAGFFVWERPLIWDKGTNGSFTDTRFGVRLCYDAILFARQGEKRVQKFARDVINIQQQLDHPHPAGKPAELYAELISRSCLPGERVADLFCGQGTIFSAAAATHTLAYGWELNPTYFAMAAERRSKLESTP